MTMQEQLRALVERHLVNLVEQLATVTESLTPEGDRGALRLAQVVEAQAVTHQLKGTAASMGFPDIGATAGALEENLKILEKMPEPLSAEQLQPALELLATLRRIAESTTPAMSTLYNADLSKLTR
jgi:HPt (histidine-containing phosphotransfer) domain-containing protein